MDIIQFSNSLVGLKRENNEDSYFCDIRDNMSIFVVADGMGGHFGGEIASNCLIEKIKRCWNNITDEVSLDILLDDLKSSISEANTEIYEHYSSTGKICGTTLALMVIINKSMFLMNIGDTHIYSFRKIKLIQESTDHVFYEEEIRKDNPSYHINDRAFSEKLTSAIGTSKDYKMDIKGAPLKPGRYLICTDGVYKYMTSFELFLSMTKPVKQSGKYIESCVNHHGAGDNFTYIMISIKE